MTRTATEIANFEKIVENYIADNISYIAEHNDDPSAQDILDHWDTNGPEGVGESLSAEERVQFLGVAERVLIEELREAAYIILEAHYGYVEEDHPVMSPRNLRYSEEIQGKLLRSKTVPELAIIVHKTEQELRDEFKENGTFF